MADNRTIVEKLRDEFIPSLASGAIGTLAASFLLGVNISDSLSIGSMSVPAWVAIGGTLTASDLVAYVSHDYIIENISFLNGISNAENKLMAPALSGVASYLLFSTFISSDASLVNSILLGAGSSIAGQYAADTLKAINPNL